MTVRVKVTPERDPTRIEGYCQIPSWPREQSVIAFTRLGDQWGSVDAGKLNGATLEAGASFGGEKML